MESNEPNILLENLRRHDAEEWKDAYQLLWQRGWRVASRLWKGAAGAEIEDVVSKALNEVVPQIITPTNKKFGEARTFADILNLAAARVRQRVMDEWDKIGRKPQMIDLAKTDEASPGDDPAVIEERLDAIRYYLALLDERCRNLLIAKEGRGQTVDEIAVDMNSSRGTVCNWLFRCRKKLADLVSTGTTSGDCPPEKTNGGSS